MRASLRLGSKVFYNGEEYLIVGAETSQDWILYDPRLPQSNAKVVRKDYLQPVASEVFQIGDRVHSRHTFRGTVTGYEEPNKVICKSDKACGEWERNRYAYSVYEINHIVEEVKTDDRTNWVRSATGSF